MSPGDDGQRFDEAASVHEKAVQAVAKGELGPVHRVRRRRKKPRRIEITSLRVNAEVWATALSLADSPNHIQIVNEDEVIVWNHPRPWPGEPSTAK